MAWEIAQLLGLFAILGFFVRGYVMEKTRRRSPQDQLLTQSELEKRCAKEHGILEGKIMGEVKRIHQLVQKDLDQGAKRFQELGNSIVKMEKILRRVETDIALIARNNKWRDKGMKGK